MSEHMDESGQGLGNPPMLRGDRLAAYREAHEDMWLIRDPRSAITVSGLCPEIMVGAHAGQPDELWTCAQRAGHPGPHNRYAPTDGCTAWADHCPCCSEHDCIRPSGVTP